MVCLHETLTRAVCTRADMHASSNVLKNLPAFLFESIYYMSSFNTIWISSTVDKTTKPHTCSFLVMACVWPLLPLPLREKCPYGDRVPTAICSLLNTFLSFPNQSEPHKILGMNFGPWWNYDALVDDRSQRLWYQALPRMSDLNWQCWPFPNCCDNYIYCKITNNSKIIVLFKDILLLYLLALTKLKNTRDKKRQFLNIWSPVNGRFKKSIL